MAGLLLTPSGRSYLLGLRLEVFTLLHTLRMAVKLGRWVLYRHHLVPQLMTFEGRNWDLLAGLSALVVTI
jgi:hypothetical protein